MLNFVLPWFSDQELEHRRKKIEMPTTSKMQQKIILLLQYTRATVITKNIDDQGARDPLIQFSPTNLNV